LRGIFLKHYDVIVIGGGLSGLTAASLLAKKGLQVGVIDKNFKPGGSCGIFKRNNVIFDQGAAMLFGFGEKGFNAHRLVFNYLEEPFKVIKHDLLYCLNFKGNRIKFWADIDRFVEELAKVFPSQKENIKTFYVDMLKIYQHVMVENPSYTTPDETDPREALKSMLKHPVSYIRFLSYLNKSAKSLLQKYFTDPEIFKFFDKLTSTYCYTSVEESPAILAAVMFVDNHFGGSYYPAGSTLFLPGKLEKVIEENGGDMLLEKEVVKILFRDNKPAGVKLEGGEEIFARNLIYSGTVWNLYGKMIDKAYTPEKTRKWAENQVATYPSSVLYAQVARTVIPDDTAPIEMLVGNPDFLDESEVTAYILSIDDKTLCDSGSQVVVAIGPSSEKWAPYATPEYKLQKEKEKERLLGVLEKRFPGFRNGVKYAEIATPRTIERYLNKNGGAVAGPKQMLGQHMFKRLHTRTNWDNLFCCGESTIMGTGTPTVTITGVSAANVLLKKLGLAPYQYHSDMKNYVTIINKPFLPENLLSEYPENTREIMLKANRCQYCESPACSGETGIDIRGILRRTSVGNFFGAKKIIAGQDKEKFLKVLPQCEKNCIMNKTAEKSVEIIKVIEFLLK
jgi:prolycopene isomerase